MIEFIYAHWFELVVVIISLVQLVLFFCKKKPMLNIDDRIDAELGSFLPSYINLAEASGLSGSEKMVFVVSNCISRLKKMVSELDEVYWAKVIQSKVEAILTTPQKKGSI